MNEKNVQRDALSAPWADHANDDEKQRLAKIQERMSFKLATVEELVAEKRKIMMRCIRRMRRKAGKS